MTHTDALIVGAGPAGLYQAFQLGLLEARSHIIDALPVPGGQCVALYGDKPIYDIPGVQVCTGRELTDSLLRQITPFQTPLHLGQVVTAIEQMPDQQWQVDTSQGQRFVCKALFIAAGVGAFQARQLKVDGAQDLDAAQLAPSLPAPPRGGRILVLGDTEAALRAAIDASEHPASQVTLIHRKHAFDASAAVLQEFRARVQAGRIQFFEGQPMSLRAQPDRSVQVNTLLNDGSQPSLQVDHVVAALGLSPKLGPIADWGLALERKHLVVEPSTCATSAPGVFAVGDIVAYAGKKKLIASGFHECIMAAYAALPYIHPGRRMQLEYTTTSSRLHRLLGVDASAPTE